MTTEEVALVIDNNEKPTPGVDASTEINANETAEAKIDEDEKEKTTMKKSVQELTTKKAVEDPNAVQATRLRLYCFGIVMGPSLEVFYWIVGIHVTVLIAVASVGFFVSEIELYPMVGVMLFTTFLSLLSFLITATTDPGVIKPASLNTLKMKKEELSDKDLESLKRCDVCNLYVEYTTRHCPWCDVCVRELDHHCGVVGICIGARNRVHFSMLTTFAGWSFWVLIISGIFFFISLVDSAQSDTLFVIVYVWTGLAYVVNLCIVMFWIAATYGWLDKPYIFGLPNVFYLIHKHPQFHRSRRKDISPWFAYNGKRTPVFKYCCQTSCTKIARDFP